MSLESSFIQSIKNIIPSDMTLVLSGRNGNVPKSDYCLIHFFDEEVRSTKTTLTKVVDDVVKFYDVVDVLSTVRLTFVGQSTGNADSYSKLLQNTIRTTKGKGYFYDNGISVNNVTQRLRIDEFADTLNYVRFVIDMTLSYCEYFEYDDDTISEIGVHGELTSLETSTTDFIVTKPIPVAPYWMWNSGDYVMFESGDYVGTNDG